ncbi:tryptophanyl-tRNA synthetase, cytoplasmic, putative [Entamoeba invadens IP1]|uniref:tryptophan--tRNA ligase n=1 Tax=Entamoeba invadens IP1 TaxID=370355 RepID=A0A0A1TZM4_ENTIV|nr:tryptophanyl-tRNA synthetase, cytoplasmic, putative [Entamoeba invadens IP1]ELP87019.1 tryptophanyl-tRNA synthetase, cytoplasmic, putative [Entamoeba invadens IP1]|eukprot:XP_004253790.1 tryptophanyl-tRNA synthetase, cytoplasmic, putative [Entamoeba invadens IP1]
MTQQIVTPYNVSGLVDYNKLVKDFNAELLTPEQITRIGSVTHRDPHIWLRRGLFFCHRDINPILDDVEKGNKIYLYTGRGPSSDALHLGHLIPFIFTQYLQEAFNAELVVQLTDDEKYLWKPVTIPETKQYTIENVKDIIAAGLDVKKTFIFNDYDYIERMYPLVTKIQSRITFNQVKGIFGFQAHDNVGKISFPAIQAAPAFPECFPHLFGKQKIRCLIPCAIDQDPYFRMTRDHAEALGAYKPSLIMSKFFPALQGSQGKMSASDPNSAIYLIDTPKQIEEKINKHACCSVKDLDLFKTHGTDTTDDVPFQYLRFFLNDDQLLDKIKTDYEAGKMMPQDVKNILIKELQELVQNHQIKRQKVTMDVVEEFMRVRKLEK